MQNIKNNSINKPTTRFPRALWQLFTLALFSCLVAIEDPVTCLIGSIHVDILFATALATYSFYKGNKWSEHILWVFLSRHIHLTVYNQIADLQLFLSLSWLLSSVLIIVMDYRRAVAPVLFYHIGLIFDPGSAQMQGMGMQLGFSAAPVYFLLLTQSLRTIFFSNLSSYFDKRYLYILLGFLWLLAFHSTGQTAHLNDAYIICASTITLFLYINCRVKSQWNNLAIALIASGFFVGFATILTGILSEPTLAALLTKRSYIQGLHPNMIATWALGASVIIFSFNKFELSFKLKALSTFICFLMIFLSGSRLILMIALVMTTWLAAFSRLKISKKYVILALVIVLPIVGARIFQSANLNEWTNNDRFFIWKAAISLIKESPITGWGALSFGQLPQKINSSKAIWVYDWNNPHTHQLILEIMLWGGIPLFILFITGWLKVFKVWHKQELAILFISVTLSTIGDFAWVKPGMLSLLLLILFLPDPRNCFSNQDEKLPDQTREKHEIADNSLVEFSRTENHPTFKHKVRLFSAKSLIILLSIFSIIGLLANHFSNALYYQSLASFTARQSSWNSELTKSLSLQPFNIQGKLQQFLWNFASRKPNKQDLKDIIKVRKTFPDYYVPWFIEGRLHLTFGNLASATYSLKKSIELDSRDLTGIRHAQLSIAEKGTNRNNVWNAFIRGSWGPALLVEHPRLASKFRKIIHSKLMLISAKDIYSTFIVSQSFKSALQHNIVPSTDFLSLFHCTHIPSWLSDEIKALFITYELSSKTIQPNDAIKKLLKENKGASQYKLLCQLALETNNFKLAQESYAGVLRTFNFRNKNSEDLISKFNIAKALLAENNFKESLEHLNHLLSFDFSNPFVYEAVGDNYANWMQPKLAIDSYQLAIKFMQSARTDPYYREQPRTVLWPEGDQWTLSFEKAIRKHEKQTYFYNSDSWNKLRIRIYTKYQANLKKIKE